MRRSKVSIYLAASDIGDAATSTLTELIEAAVRSGHSQLAGLCVLPLLTTTLIFVPIGRRLPAFLLCAITRPGLTWDE